MRILFVIRTLNPGWGGPVEGLRNLTAQAIRRGYDVEVACTDQPAAPWLRSWEVTVQAVGAGRLKKYGLNHKLDAWLMENLPRFDAIVVHSIWMYFSYAVWKATRQVPIPYFLFIHGALDPWFKQTYPLKHFKKSIYWKLVEHKVVRDAERVLFTTAEELALADHAFLPWSCAPEVTGYGIVQPGLPEDFEKAAYISTLTAAHPLLANRNFILFLGRVHEKKGIDLLLKAFAASKDSLGDLALVIAGAGEDKTCEELRRLALLLGVERDVVWTGPLYGKDKWHAMCAAEVYALPSHQENFGISIVEALACGLPVLVSNKVNIWREIETSKAGFVAPDDIAGTTALLREWAATTSQEKVQLRLNAKQCFARHFDIVTTSDRFFSILLSRRSTRQNGKLLPAVTV